MCTQEQLKKDHFTVIRIFLSKEQFLCTNLLCICIITEKWMLVTKLSKPVSKETFVEALKVADRSLKVMN